MLLDDGADRRLHLPLQRGVPLSSSCSCCRRSLERRRPLGQSGDGRPQRPPAVPSLQDKQQPAVIVQTLGQRRGRRAQELVGPVVPVEPGERLQLVRVEAGGDDDGLGLEAGGEGDDDDAEARGRGRERSDEPRLDGCRRSLRRRSSCCFFSGRAKPRALSRSATLVDTRLIS